MLFKDLFHNASASVLWAQFYDKIYLYLIQISQSSFILFLQESDNRCGDTHLLASNNGGRKSAKLDETRLEIVGQMEYM